MGRSRANGLGAQVGGGNANMVLLSDVLSEPVSCYWIPTGVYCPVRACSSERRGPPTYNRVHDETAGIGRIARYGWGGAAHSEGSSPNQLRSSATGQQAPVTDPIPYPNRNRRRRRGLERLTS